MHKVKCKFCGEYFDRDKVPFYRVSNRRYAHAECQKEHEENKSQEEKDFDLLMKYIKFLFKDEYNPARVAKQLKEFQTQYGYTYSGIFKSLKWWYEIKHNSVEKANGGIGIVPYIYNDAKQYYYNLFLIKSANENKNIKDYTPKAQKITISPPKSDVKEIKFFDLEGELNGEK